MGLGVGIYDEDGKDHSQGTGDIDRFSLDTERSSKGRPVFIPDDLAEGEYELIAEIWPPNKVGADGEESIAEFTCTVFIVK